jgi:hypothetical protein
LYSFIFNGFRNYGAWKAQYLLCNGHGRALAFSKLFPERGWNPQMSHHPPAEPSWIERTIRLCDHVLTAAAKANPANLLLRDLTPRNKPAHPPEQKTKPKSSSNSNLLSEA